MLKFLLLCLLVLIISKCSHEQISFPVIENQSDKLRLDGGYFQFHKGDKKAGLSDFFLGYIFYKNGVVLRLGGNGNDISPDYKFNSKTAQELTSSGLYIISDTNIYLERWYASTQGKNLQPPAIKILGKIISKEKIELNEPQYPSNAPSVKKSKSIFSFFKLNNKPDSINCFVPIKLNKTECEKLYD